MLLPACVYRLEQQSCMQNNKLAGNGCSAKKWSPSGAHLVGTSALRGRLEELARLGLYCLHCSLRTWEIKTLKQRVAMLHEASATHSKRSSS